MSSRIIRLPDIGEGITEAEIVEWLVTVGESVLEDQSIGTVMTDKAAVEIPSPVAGVVETLSGDVGDVLPVGAEYARIKALDEDEHTVNDVDSPVVAPNAQSATGDDDADAAALHAPDAQPAVYQSVEGEHAPAKVSPPVAEPGGGGRKPAQVKFGGDGERPLSAAKLTRRGKPTASPSVRRHAYQYGLLLPEITGTGPAGRILHEDILRHLAEQGQRTVSPWETEALSRDDSAASANRSAGLVYESESDKQTAGSPSPSVSPNEVQAIPVTGMRRAIARKMQQSKQHIPHFSYVEETDVTALEALREELNNRAGKARPRLTLLPFIILSMLRSLKEFPRMNSLYDDDAEIIHQYRDAHVGIATQTDKGLMVPVVHRADALELRSLASQIANLAQAAREGRLKPADMAGGTITVTSLGALGGLVSTPVINYPQVAIVGVNRIITRPVFQGDVVVPRKMMNLSCSFDHRVVDGHDAAKFVQRMKSHIEFPVGLFVDI